MIVSDILDELKEALGTCETSRLLMLVSNGCEILANKGLFDPLIATYNFSTNGQNLVALPRDAKAILRVNIDRQPTFSRSRIFEFTLNTNGTEQGDEIGYAWHDRGYSPIQSEENLPGPLNYLAESPADDGKTVAVTGLDIEGRAITETITAKSEDPVAGSKIFYSITSVVRATTADDCALRCNGEKILANYYPDERAPSYRLIRLSKKVAAVRVMYRRKIFRLSSVSDLLPLHSRMAIVQAAVAAKFLLGGNMAEYTAAIDIATAIINEEQGSRDESTKISQSLELQQAVDHRLSAPRCCVVGDVYPDASDIMGPVGRERLMSKIAQAVEILENKGHWDSAVGAVDVMSLDGTNRVVLPRFVDSPIAIAVRNTPFTPSNKWFEFSINGSGFGDVAGSRWQDDGQVATISQLPKESDGTAIPCRLVAIPDSSEDNDATIRIFGLERLDDGRDVEVWREGVRGWLCPCFRDRRDPGADAPLFTSVTEIVRDETNGMVSLIAISGDSRLIALVGDAGYPDVAGSAQNAVESLIKSQNPDELVLLGDNNYPLGEASTIDLNIGAHWRRFIYPYAGSQALRDGETDATENHCWPVLGNHDWGNTNPNPNGADPHLEYFTLPGNERYYDRVFGDAHFFFLDSEPNEPDGNTIGSTQYLWLVAAIAASTARFKICCFHRPPKSSGHQWGSYTPMQWDFANLGVDAVCCGHGHNYERWEEGGVTYFTVGTGGSSLESYDAPPAQSAARLMVAGALILEITPQSLTFRFKDTAGAVRDSFIITSGVAESEDVILGRWYPDETNPRYAAIRIPQKSARSVKVMFRKRAEKITSMFQPLNLRSKSAITAMLRSMKAEEAGDIQSAESHEAIAVRRLNEDSIRDMASGRPTLQFSGQDCPGTTRNIM